MRHARTAALLTSVLSAGITVGYGAVPTSVTRAVMSRVGLAPHGPIGATLPADSPGAAGLPGTSGDRGGESSRLRTLRSPEFELFGEASATARPQTSRPAAICGTGLERRICNGPPEADDPEAKSTRRVDPDGAPTDASWLVGLRAPELPVHASVRVERFFRYLTESTNGRKLFRAWLRKSGRYHDVVARSLRDRGLPADLEALVFVESGYSPTAVSSEGAAGLWQFMPGTARVYGLAVEEDFDQRRSIEKASDAGTRYLSDLHERFGSWELALAAYDMGYGRLIERVQQSSSNDYWTLSLIPGALPDETLSYVPKVLAVAILLRNLDRFGFDEVQSESAAAAAGIDVAGGAPLSLVARAAGTSLDKLRLLNPEFLTSFVPDRGQSLSVRVPSRGVARANAMLPRLLARWHPGSDDAGVDDGFDWGKDEPLPAGPASRRGPRTSSIWDAPVTAPSLLAPPVPPAARSADVDAAADDVDTDADDRATVFYRVDDGETLGAIAHRFGERSSRIVAENHLDPAAKLQKGMLLKLHAPRSAISRLASVRILDDSKYAPLVQPEGSAASDDDSPIASPAPASSPDLRSPRDEGVWPSIRTAPGGPRVKHTHGGRALGRSSMADFPELFARKP